MVEDAVEQHPQPAPVRLGDQMVEVGVVAEPRVDAVVVGGVVTVCAGGEQRPERDAGRAEFDGVVEPVDDPAQSVFVGRGRRFGGEGADEAQRVDLPPDRVLRPRPVRSWPELRLVEGLHLVLECRRGPVDDDCRVRPWLSGARRPATAAHPSPPATDVSWADEVA